MILRTLSTRLPAVALVAGAALLLAAPAASAAPACDRIAQQAKHYRYTAVNHFAAGDAAAGGRLIGRAVALEHQLDACRFVHGSR